MATVLPVSYLAKTSSLKHEEMLVQNYQRSKTNFKNIWCMLLNRDDSILHISKSYIFKFYNRNW